MRRIAGLAVLVCLIGYLAMPLAAQDMLVTPQIPYGFLSKENAVFLERIVVIKKSVLQPAGMPKYLHFNFDDLLRSPVQWPRDLLITGHFERRQQGSSAVSREAFCAYFNTPKVDQEKLIRQEWKRTFGMDVWVPYYKAKEVEDWVKERFSVRIFKLKGRPEFKKNRFTYTFKTRF